MAGSWLGSIAGAISGWLAAAILIGRSERLGKVLFKELPRSLIFLGFVVLGAAIGAAVGAIVSGLQ